MARSKSIKNVDAIFCADIHARSKQPVCRLDAPLKTQSHKLEWLKNLQLKYEVPVFNAGDLVDSWHDGHEVVTMLMESLPEDFVTILGQHDLPKHNRTLIRKSAVAPLIQSKSIFNYGAGDQFSFCSGKKRKKVTVSFSPWETDPGLIEADPTAALNILIIHELVWKKEPWPGAPSSGNYKAILKRYKNFDTIICGDNHEAFKVKTKSGRLLINCGTMYRNRKDMKDYEPRVWLWDAQKNDAVPAYYPIKTGVFVDEDDTKVADTEISELVERLSDGVEIGMDFSTNLERYIKSHEVSSGVKKVLRKVLGELS